MGSTSNHVHRRTVSVMDMVTVFGLIAAGVMFIAGVAIVGFGLRRHAEPLPHGAQDVLDAVADGRLRPNGVNYTDRGVVPTRLTQSMPLAEPPGEASSIRLIPREKPEPVTPRPATPAPVSVPAASGQPVVAPAPRPTTEPSSSPVTVPAAAPTPRSAPVPAVASADDSFFTSPGLQRI